MISYGRKERIDIDFFNATFSHSEETAKVKRIVQVVH